MSKLLLIDADTILYRCGLAVEKTKYLVEYGIDFNHLDTSKEVKLFTEALADKDAASVWTRKTAEPLENALELVKNVLTDIQDRYADWSECRLWLTPGVGNFREAIATRAKYKGNRDGTARPVHYNSIRDYLVDKWGARYTVGQEADDAIGIDMSDNPGSVCVSFDKDMLQLPGRHYNWVDKSEQTVTPKQGSKFFYQQALSGDPTDNIPGCKGIGEVKAKKLLEECNTQKECWSTVLCVYSDVYGDKDGPEFALETARLVRVRRKPNEIWNPPV